MLRGLAVAILGFGVGLLFCLELAISLLHAKKTTAMKMTTNDFGDGDVCLGDAGGENFGTNPTNDHL